VVSARAFLAGNQKVCRRRRFCGTGGMEIGGRAKDDKANKPRGPQIPRRFIGWGVAEPYFIHGLESGQVESRGRRISYKGEKIAAGSHKRLPLLNERKGGRELEGGMTRDKEHAPRAGHETSISIQKGCKRFC